MGITFVNFQAVDLVFRLIKEPRVEESRRLRYDIDFNTTVCAYGVAIEVNLSRPGEIPWVHWYVVHAGYHNGYYKSFPAWEDVPDSWSYTGGGTREVDMLDLFEEGTKITGLRIKMWSKHVYMPTTVSIGDLTLCRN